MSTATATADVFTDAVRNDVLISTTTEFQRILLGPRGGATSTACAGCAVLRVDGAEVAVRGDLMVTGTVYADEGISVGPLPPDAGERHTTPPGPAVGSVGTAALQDGAVTPSKLAAGAVTASALGLLSVTTGAIADAAITAMQLAGAAVTATAIASGAVGNTALAEACITASKLDPGLLAELHSTTLIDGIVTTVKIADSNVTFSKLAPEAIVRILTSNAQVVTPSLTVEGSTRMYGDLTVYGHTRMAGLYVTKAMPPTTNGVNNHSASAIHGAAAAALAPLQALRLDDIEVRLLALERSWLSLGGT